MSKTIKKLEELQRRKAAIEAEIVQAGIVAKNKNRVERLVVRMINKHPDMFSCDPAELEKSLDESFAGFATKLKSSKQP